MNGKQAKRLRKIALGFASTMVDAGSPITKEGYEIRNGTNQLLTKRNSVRGIYKNLKSKM